MMLCAAKFPLCRPFLPSVLRQLLLCLALSPALAFATDTDSDGIADTGTTLYSTSFTEVFFGAAPTMPGWSADSLSWAGYGNASSPAFLRANCSGQSSCFSLINKEVRFTYTYPAEPTRLRFRYSLNGFMQLKRNGAATGTTLPSTTNYPSLYNWQEYMVKVPAAGSQTYAWVPTAAAAFSITAGLDDVVVETLPDNCPTVANPDQADSSNDGVGDACDFDTDNDGLDDAADNCPAIANANQQDTDSDSLGDACDEDIDADSVLNSSDNCDYHANMDQLDIDGDLVGDVCDDSDSDGVMDATDNCRVNANSNQLDTDGDSSGNACDVDDDNDNVADDVDAFPLDPTESADSDNDGQGDVADTDDDNDTVVDTADNCPHYPNTNQLDSDGNGVGDICQNGLATAVWNTALAGPNAYVYAVEAQPDGKTLIGGNFTTVNGLAINRIARLNDDGSLDAGFVPGAGANAAVYDVLVQPDGKILIAGSFTAVNGVARNRIARLNSDGSLDTGFVSDTGPNNPVWAVALQSDGRVVLGGYFSRVNGQVREAIARLHTDGTLDTTFTASVTGNGRYLHTLAVQADDSIVIGGYFLAVQGTALNNIAHLNADGSLDTGFIAPSGDVVLDVLTLPAGKTLLARQSGAVQRLNADGSLDSSFATGTGGNAAVYDLTLQSDGRLIAAGDFSQWNGVAQGRLLRLNIDGSLDTGFNIGAGPNGTLYAADLHTYGGMLIVGGDFTQYPGRSNQYVTGLYVWGDADLDGAENQADAFPLNPDESLDTDGDGFGNNADSDDDDDTVPDYIDADPLDNAVSSERVLTLDGSYEGSSIKDVQD